MNNNFEKKNKKIAKKNKINDILNQRSKLKTYELILFGFLIMIISVFLTVVITQEISIINISEENNIFSSNNELEEFEEVYEIINDSYYKKVDKNVLIDGAINGMLSALDDPHTSYFNKAETDNFNEQMNGEYDGIGAEVALDKDGNVIVFSVFKNSPAAEVGLKFNDIIKEVNGKQIKNMSTTEVVELIKDVNKPVANIKVEREGKTLEFNIKKRKVVIESVESKVFKKNGKNIGYIVINTFANNTYEQFRKQLEDLEKKEISGLVIDVRGNSGGFLHSVTSILDMFLPKGKEMYQIEDRKEVYKYSATTSESRNYPVAVLTNKGSASASEILAISLKESYNAFVVGTSTYGKGTVQTTRNLKDGSMIKYTIQKWLSPKGKWINEVGVEPTHVVELGSDYENNPTEENDNQLQKALNLVSE